ncbi:tripartite tricarboxylate transporter substrate binding protein [Achromobacter sp. GG226]|uniref:Bug family tripartite tricarboxylate transporter substrate binding protein n=1 Tax=Verticiella alkaliphila TaxID=2779529 RepID=UPI001C0C314D|nr:tripartite tricarboxylate transporter substrate binding protein [Verticiella sp. GG226]MBU4612824.1 tripartite tricarboxylate transporter substrate binding protein [Verticiella sp. GG226]
MRTFIQTLAALAASVSLVAGAHADTYPSKPIRMVVGFAPGGSADINARAVSQQLSKDLGGTILVENKGGAGGNIAAVDVKRSPADGYTLFYATSAVVLAPSLYASPGFDPYTDYVPVSLTATIPLVLVVNKNVPAQDAKTFFEWAKAQKGNLNYGSSGTGALLHLGGALLSKEMGIDATHIAYKGSAPAVTDLLAGATQFMFLPINEAMPHIKGGGLRALAVSHSERVALLPDVPTLREATGKTTMDMGAWQGVMLPKGTPEDVVAKVSEALQKTVQSTDLTDRLQSQGSIMLGGTQQDYVDYMRAEGSRWARVIQDTGAKAE